MSIWSDRTGTHVDGALFNNAASGGAVFPAVVTGTISAAAMKTARATPVELVPAPAAGYVHEFISAVFFFDYTAAFTESADNLAIKVENGSGVAVSDTIETTGFLDATADKIIKAVSVKDALLTAAKALVLHNIGDGEFGGTGSPVRFAVTYNKHATGF